uniref:Uncharacterized protein n=1 Tax=Arundo donax TaxID=35708 RepID=A0A0A9A939_ARUDO
MVLASLHLGFWPIATRICGLLHYFLLIHATFSIVLAIP